MVSSSKSHYPSRRSRRTAAVIATSLLTSSVSPVTAFAQDPVKDANNFVQGLAGNLPQAPAMPGLPAASPPANGGTETKPSDTAAAPSATMPALPDLANSVPTDATKATQDVVDKVTQGVQAFNDTVKAPEETFEVEVDGEGTTDKAKVTITKKIADPANGKVHLKGENWKNKDNKGSTILVRLKGYDAQTGAENIFKQENPASQQSPADGKAADPEIYWKIEAKEDGTFEGDYDLPKNLIPGQGLKLEFETNAATNDFSRKKTTESLVIGGTEYVEKQAAPARAVPRAMAAAVAPVQKRVEEKAAEATAKAAEIESTAKEAAESAKAEALATGSAVANAVMAPQAPGGSAEPTDSDKATASTTPSAAPSTQPPAPSTTQTSPSTTPSTSGTASSKTSTPPNNSGTSQSTTASTQPPKDDKKQNDSSSTDTIKDINYLLKEIKNFDKAFENLLGAAALAALSSSGGSNIPGLPGGSNNSTKTTAPTTPRAGGQAGNAGGNKTGTGTSGNGTAGKASTGGTSGGKSTTGGAAAGTKTTQKGTSTNALSGLGSLSSLLGGTGRGTSVGGTRTSGTTTGGATRSTNGTGATRTTTGTNGTSPATGARVINPNTNGRAAAGARAAGAAGAGSAKATTSNSASASSKPQPKHTPKPPVKTRDQLTQKNAHGVTGTLKNETLTMKIPRLKSGDWAYLYIYSADTTQKPVGVAWAQLDSTGSVKLDTKDLPDGEYTVAAVDEKDQLVGWVDMKLGEIKNAAVEGDNNDKVVAAQAGVMSATDWWMIGASMLIPLLTASMIYAFRRPRRS
ncbi:hypothetical protein [Corynebacterium matruchotii]|uniref:hypothetical protein n=1 Tax=Corynebacterium matruchotii TaxID=43768 RepID=UPI0028F06851|nr:hypothetical protein [Corynebacterium matruchotii]